MSVATAFRFAEAFPFCVTDISGSVPGSFAYIDNLTLADIMPFAWNLENIELTTEGDLDYGGGITIDGDSVTEINPMFSDRFDVGSTNGNMWFGDALSSVAFSSWPPIRQPVGRVCEPSSVAINGALLDFGATIAAAPAQAQCQFGFFVGTDPVNAGKYRLYYDISFHFSDPPTTSTDLNFQSVPIGGGLTAWNSGTITIAGLTFNWYSGYSGSPSITGTGTLTATSQSFTYP